MSITALFGLGIRNGRRQESYVRVRGEEFPEGVRIIPRGLVREDLMMTSSGVPLCFSTAKLIVRRADESEIVIYRNAALQAQTEDLVLAYLVNLDRAWFVIS